MIKNIILKLENLIVFAQSKLTERQFIFLSSILVGISAAFAVIVLKSFAHWVFEFATYINKTLKISFINSILPIIGIVLTVFVVKKVLGGVIEKGTSQILFAVAKKSSIIPKKQMYAQIITSSLTVGLGGSAGLESPIVITGAAFGSNYAQKYKLSYKNRTLLIGCGVAAGIAAAFNAPIAGVLFAIEVLLVDVSISAFTPIIISAATGALVAEIVLQENVLLNFKQQESFDFHNVPFYILLGIFTGLMAIYHSRNFQKVEHFFSRLKLKPYKKAIFGATLLATLIFIFPTLFGEGYESIKILSNKNPGQILENTLFESFKNNNLVLLIFVGCTMFLKAFATGITLGSGGNGGNFAPSLFLGSYIGFLFSKIINLTGFTQLPIGNFTLVGMAGILSGLFHAPLTAIFLIAEITGGYNLMIPLMIVSSISFAISKRFEKHSMDVKKLAQKGQAFTANKDTNILNALDLHSFIENQDSVLDHNDNLEHLIKLISNTKNTFFAVHDDDKNFVGTVCFDDVKPYIFNAFRLKHTFMKEVLVPKNHIISWLNNMETVMDIFDLSKADALPVVKNNQFVGFVYKQKILEAYRNKLQSMSIE
jgi:chloride channel protein, CIC family